MLLSRGSDPNVTEHNKGYSALMMSAADNNLAIVELLVQHGANISYKTVLGTKEGNDNVATSMLQAPLLGQWPSPLVMTMS